MINTWADGFGRWHARVPAGDNAGRVARKAILTELLARENGPLNVRVIPADPALHARLDGTVVYRERTNDE